MRKKDLARDLVNVAGEKRLTRPARGNLFGRPAAKRGRRASAEIGQGAILSADRSIYRIGSGTMKE